MKGCPLCEAADPALLERMYGMEGDAKKVQRWWKRHYDVELELAVIQAHYAHHGAITGRRVDAAALLGTNLPERQRKLLYRIWQHGTVYSETLLATMPEGSYKTIKSARAALYRDLKKLLWSGYITRLSREQMDLMQQDPGLKPLQARNSIYKLTHAGFEWLKIVEDLPQLPEIISDQITLTGQSLGVKLGATNKGWEWNHWYTGVRWQGYSVTGLVRVGKRPVIYMWDGSSVVSEQFWTNQNKLLEQAKGALVIYVLADRYREGELLKSWRKQRYRWEGVEHAEVCLLQRELLWQGRPALVNVDSGQALLWQHFGAQKA